MPPARSRIWRRARSSTSSKLEVGSDRDPIKGAALQVLHSGWLLCHHPCRSRAVILGQIVAIPMASVQSRQPQAARFNAYLARSHYLPQHGGENFRYLMLDCQGRDLSCVLFGTASWKTQPPDAMPTLAGRPAKGSISSETAPRLKSRRRRQRQRLWTPSSSGPLQLDLK